MFFKGKGKFCEYIFFLFLSTMFICTYFICINAQFLGESSSFGSHSICGLLDCGRVYDPLQQISSALIDLGLFFKEIVGLLWVIWDGYDTYFREGGAGLSRELFRVLYSGTIPNHPITFGSGNLFVNEDSL